MENHIAVRKVVWQIQETILGITRKYDGIDIKVGDTIKVSVPKDLQCPEDALRMREEDSGYYSSAGNNESRNLKKEKT